MDSSLNTIACLVLGAAAFLAAMNWNCLFANRRNKRLGVDKHHSFVMVVPQILVGLAALISRRLVHPWLPSWSFWLVALADVSLLSLAIWPFILIRQRLQSQSK